jgi:hypothetical protein
MVYWPFARTGLVRTTVPAPDLLKAMLEPPPAPVMTEFIVSVLPEVT